MFEELIKELKDMEKVVGEKLKEIEGKTEEELLENIKTKDQMWSSADAIKGYSMFKEDLMKKPFEGAFPDVFKPFDQRSKNEDYMLKKYIYMRNLENKL